MGPGFPHGTCPWAEGPRTAGAKGDTKLAVSSVRLASNAATWHRLRCRQRTMNQSYLISTPRWIETILPTAWI